MLYAILTVALILVDQAVKFWIRFTLPIGGTIPILPGVIDFTYVQNTGAAYSILASHTWLLTLLSAVVSIVLIILLLRHTFQQRLGQLSLALILAGAVGNFIDRFFFGFVVDMFHLQFVDFPVFNVADIGVTVGGVLLVIYVLFFYEKKEKKRQDEEAS